MQPRTAQFKENARAAIADPHLQSALGELTQSFVAGRAAAVAACDNFEALRTAGRDIRDRTLANLDAHLIQFERQARAAGADVHWAATDRDACEIIVGLCRNAGARAVAKGKSMISEEIALNASLEAAGINVVETDLGEYLLQLREDWPSHIIAPAIHLTQQEVSRTFRRKHSKLPEDRKIDTATDLVAEARGVLRETFLSADVGITGANFLVAETGSVVVVTNEGNGDLCATLPKVHIVLASIEKVVPALEDAAILLRLLARSGTGQDMTAYTSIFTGPRRRADADGPIACHIVILDNGRAELLGSEFRDVLRCIRCGACLNHCPVYRAVGGHAYGWVYPGPIGAVLTPAILGIERAEHLPEASTFCGRCEEVCPVKIPLPKLMRLWRNANHAAAGGSPSRYLLRLWRWTALRPQLYHFAARIAAAFLRARPDKFRWLPFAHAWTAHRAFPASQGRTFQHLWRLRRLKQTS